MHRRAPRSAAATLSAVLASGLLAGCSSSTPQPLATLGGGPAAATGPAGPAAAPSAATTLSNDFTVDVNLSVTGTATQVTLLTQAKALLLAYEKAVEANDPKDPGYQSLVTGKATTSLYQSVSDYKTAGQRPTGTVVFYQFTTDVSPGLGADVLFCEDQSQEHLVDFSSGAPMADADTGKQRWDLGFNANSNGSWTIAYVSAQATAAGSTQCT